VRGVDGRGQPPKYFGPEPPLNGPLGLVVTAMYRPLVLIIPLICCVLNADSGRFADTLVAAARRERTAFVGLDDYQVGAGSFAGARERRHPDAIDGPRRETGDQTGPVRPRIHDGRGVRRRVATQLRRRSGRVSHPVADYAAVMLSRGRRLPRYADARSVYCDRFDRPRSGARR